MNAIFHIFPQASMVSIAVYSFLRAIPNFTNAAEFYVKISKLFRNFQFL